MSRSGTDGALLRVRVQPRASRNEIVGWRGDALGVRVTAPPVAGQANVAVTAVVAEALGVRASAVTVVRGERGRDKLLRVAGVSPAEVRARLARGEGGGR
ncbi:MAG: DUF167 domain-containing protein [Candidatus Rokuibacteriota bacterium]